MLRTILIIGVLTLLGIVALKLAFGILGALVLLLLWLLAFAVKAAVVGLIVYGIIRLVSPATAQRIRRRLSPTRP